LYIFIGQEGGPSFYSCATVGWVKLTHETYTKCSAPTDVNIYISGDDNGKYITSGGRFEIRWSGAAPGNANDIESYDIYYEIGSTPTLSSTIKHNFKTSATKGSFVFDLPTPTSSDRGKQIKCGIVARSSVDAIYNSDL
jgi:hypothetical protein